jgi:hypothetical protein
LSTSFSRAPNAELRNFNTEAARFCNQICGNRAQEYALDYAKMLRCRAVGRPLAQPENPPEVAEVVREVIASKLERLFEKYFPKVP